MRGVEFFEEILEFLSSVLDYGNGEWLYSLGIIRIFDSFSRILGELRVEFSLEFEKPVRG
ncbi:hypothetical protein WN55_08228 [Dufourea novaeangliae]|uniref:Uncharacterized protein n=1 Tax=Dufourea novaeangliae TaxID=178035 RepID=A0A154P6G2_DUFNO|nr:hypothetical protein WN55_08228 [Dufourea novaeangliae]